MDLDRFVATHRADWDRLRQLTRRSRLSGEDADEFVDLYGRASTDLSAVRSEAPDPVLVAELSTLVARARGITTGTRRFSTDDIARYFVEDFDRWKAWSPWEHIDPTMKRTLTGAPRGPGAVYAWQGNADVGQGRMEVIDYAAPTSVTIKLDFIEPMATSNVTQFVLTPNGETTTVTWHMSGPMPFMSKLISVFTSSSGLFQFSDEKV